MSHQISSEIIPFDKRDGVIWLNGEFVDWKNAKIHILNHSLHYGSAVFEGTRMYKGKIFQNSEHNARLLRSAEIMGYQIPYTLEQINQACEDVCKKNNLSDAYIRPFAWLGSENLKVYAPGNSVNLAVAAWVWPSYYSQEAKLKGLRVMIAKYRRPSPETAPVAAKAACLYSICTISKRIATEQKYDEALMLDYRGFIAEGTASNFFAVFGNELHTPIAEGRFLNGITRLTVINLAKKLGFGVVERDILLDELEQADDAFFTGTASEITRINSIDFNDRSINFKVSGITLGLITEFEKVVGI